MTTIAQWHARHADCPRLERELLLTDLFCRNRAWVIAHPDHPLEPAQEQRLESAAQRLRRGEPLAYIRGVREFRGLPLQVSPAVLVPRPETELLVEACLELVQPGDRVLDLGTGSGAVAIAVALARPDAAVEATDLSTAALDVARSNAARLGACVRFTEGSWFEPFGVGPGPAFDIVVSNPPYIASGHPALGSLVAEPQMALVSGADGLDALRVIITGAGGHCRRWLLLEHGWDQGPAVRGLMTAAGFTAVTTLQDLAGHDRVTRGARA